MSTTSRRLSSSRKGSVMGSDPPKSWVKAQLRSADSESGLDALAWEGPGGPDTWYESALDASENGGAWIQYRLVLGSKNSLNTPRLTRVEVRYESP